MAAAVELATTGGMARAARALSVPRASLSRARRPAFAWDTTEHRHDGLGLLTPEVVHSGRTEAVRERRRTILAAVYAAHPERFVRTPPEPPAPPAAVWINRPGPAVMEVPH